MLILNGPNLNLLGKRQPELYGWVSFDSFLIELRNRFNGQCTIDYFQSNAEYELINQIHQAEGKYQGIIINGGGLAHTSVALADAIRSVAVPTISVHISNTHIREDYRKHDLLSVACDGAMIGLGMEGYALAVDQLMDQYRNATGI